MIKLCPLILLFFCCGCQKEEVFQKIYPELEAYAKYDKFLSGVKKNYAVFDEIYFLSA